MSASSSATLANFAEMRGEGVVERRQDRLGELDSGLRRSARPTARRRVGRRSPSSRPSRARAALAREARALARRRVRSRPARARPRSAAPTSMSTVWARRRARRHRSRPSPASRARLSSILARSPVAAARSSRLPVGVPQAQVGDRRLRPPRRVGSTGGVGQGEVLVVAQLDLGPHLDAWPGRSAARRRALRHRDLRREQRVDPLLGRRLAPVARHQALDHLLADLVGRSGAAPGSAGTLPLRKPGMLALRPNSPQTRAVSASTAGERESRSSAACGRGRSLRRRSTTLIRSISVLGSW